MAYRPPVAVFDACVLYPFHIRNLLVQFAVDRLWTPAGLTRIINIYGSELVDGTRSILNRDNPTFAAVWRR